MSATLRELERRVERLEKRLRAVAPVASNLAPMPPPVCAALAEACGAFHVTEADAMSACRRFGAAHARFAVIHCLTERGWTLTDAARMVGRDDSLACHARRVVRDMMETHTSYARKVAAVVAAHDRAQGIWDSTTLTRHEPKHH